MNNQEFAYLDGKLTDIIRHTGDTNAQLAALNERAATKQDVGHLSISVTGLHSRVGSVEKVLEEVVRFQKTCPAISDLNYEQRRKKEISQNRKAMYATVSAVVAFVSALGALWNTIFSAPSNASMDTKMMPAVTPPKTPPRPPPTPPQHTPAP